MTDDRFERSDPSQLAELMRLGSCHTPLWQRDEMASLLQHQLAAPLLLELAGVDPTRRRQVEDAIGEAGGALGTFRDLLNHAEPPQALLRMAIAYFSSLEEDPDSPLPGELARALRLANIAAALVRHGARLTELDDGPLRREFEWVASQPWIEDTTKLLCERGLRRLAS